MKEKEEENGGDHTDTAHRQSVGVRQPRRTLEIHRHQQSQQQENPIDRLKTNPFIEGEEEEEPSLDERERRFVRPRVRWCDGRATDHRNPTMLLDSTGRNNR